MFSVQMQADEVTDSGRGEACGYADGEATVRIANEAKESGYEIEPGPLDWLNSARITTDPGDDAVHCVVSVGDPRGGFGFTVRRLSDGRLVIHTPYPGEGLPHMATRQINPGTLEVGHYDPDKPENYGGPTDFTSETPETDEDDD